MADYFGNSPRENNLTEGAFPNETLSGLHEVLRGVANKIRCMETKDKIREVADLLVRTQKELPFYQEPIEEVDVDRYMFINFGWGSDEELMKKEIQRRQGSCSCREFRLYGICDHWRKGEHGLGWWLWNQRNYPKLDQKQAPSR